jgi:hypothetical protein
MCVVSNQIDNHNKEELRIEREQSQERLEELVNKFDELTEEFVETVDKFGQDLIEIDMLMIAEGLKTKIQKFNDDLPEI